MDLKIDILTSRKYEKRPWFDLVYEWEDEIKELYVDVKKWRKACFIF